MAAAAHAPLLPSSQTCLVCMHCVSLGSMCLQGCGPSGAEQPRQPQLSLHCLCSFPKQQPHIAHATLLNLLRPSEPCVLLHSPPPPFLGSCWPVHHPCSGACMPSADRPDSETISCCMPNTHPHHLHTCMSSLQGGPKGGWLLGYVCTWCTICICI